MGFFIGILFLIIEVLILALLLSKVKRYKSLTIKDTIVYPLLFVATFALMSIARSLYMEKGFIELIKESFNDALGIIKLALNSEIVALLKANSGVMLVAYYGMFLISAAALSSLTIYLLVLTIKNSIRLSDAMFRGREIIFILGYNDDAKKAIKHFYDEDVKTIVVLNSGTIDKHVEEKAFINKHNIAFVEYPYKEREDYITMIKKATKSKRKNYTFITFFPNDKTNEEFSNEAIKYLLDVSKRQARENVRFVMSVDVIQDHYIQSKIYNGNRLDITNGRLRTYNKYDLNAYVFNQKHTFAKYIHSVETEEEKYIHSDCTITGCDIHAYFIGFGQVNQTLLRDVLINNQFVEKCENENGKFTLKPKRIGVDVYDERKKINALDLSNGLFKYHKDSFHAENYLDLPEDYISHIEFHMDTNVEDINIINTIYDGIKERIKRNKTKQFNFFFISLQSDMYNSLMADLFKKNLDAISGSYNFYYVKKEIVGERDKEQNNLFYMFDNKEIFSHKNILMNNVYNSAKYENYVYSKGEKPNEKEVSSRWMTLPRIKQKSNLYAVNGLYFKKDLLNADENDYIAKYNPNQVDPVGEEDIDRLVKPRKSFDPIDVLAYIEHERWNAFELANGVLPMKKSLFFKLNKGRSGEEAINQTQDGNYHFCIASAKGLVEYYHLFKERGLKDPNVIAYDYDSMNNYLQHKKILEP